MTNGYGNKQGLRAMLLAIALVAAACGGSSGSDTATAADPAAEETTATTPVAATTPPDEVTDEDVDDAFAAMEESVGDFADDAEELEPDAPETTTTTSNDLDTDDEPAAPAASGTSLAPDASLDEVQAAVADIVGPTDDVAGQTRRLGQFPAEVPTLPDASIFDFQSELRKAESNESVSHSTRVGYWTSATAPDALTFYETQLATLGYEIRDTASQESSDGATVSSIRSSLSDEGSLSARTLNVEIRTGDYEGTKVAFWYQAVDSNADQALPYVSWTSSSPLPEGGEVRSVKLVITPFGAPPTPRSFTGFSSAFVAFDGVDEATLRTQIGEVLNSGGEYALTGDIDSFKIAMSSPRFKDVGVTIQSGATDSSADLQGTWDIPTDS